MIEVRRLTEEDLRHACIKNDWYTLGDCEEYKKILIFSDAITNVTTDELKKIARDIKYHSETEYDVSSIMFILANEYCKYLFFEGVGEDV